VLIVVLSRQTYSEQSIQPLLHKVAPKEVIVRYLPDVTIQYNGATIVAQKEPYRFIEFIFRKASHLGIYAMLAITAALGMSVMQVRRKKGWIVPPIVLGFTFLVSILDEGLQSNSARRTPAVQDVVIDLIGAAAGLLILMGIQRWRKHLRDRRENFGQHCGKEE